jgi:hypothetical protein
MPTAEASGSGSNGGGPFVCLAEALLGETGVSRSDGLGARACVSRGASSRPTSSAGSSSGSQPRGRMRWSRCASQRLDPGHDSLLREWVAVAPAAKESWIALARQARHQRPPPPPLFLLRARPRWPPHRRDHRAPRPWSRLMPTCALAVRRKAGSVSRNPAGALVRFTLDALRRRGVPLIRGSEGGESNG